MITWPDIRDWIIFRGLGLREFGGEGLIYPRKIQYFPFVDFFDRGANIGRVNATPGLIKRTRRFLD